MALHRLPWSIVDGDRLVREMIYELDESWWSKEQDLVVIDHSAHLDFLAELTRDLNPATAGMIYEREDQVEWVSLYSAKTHGRPRFINVKADELGELVIEGDQLATGAIPDVLAVDYGMIMLSALGFDRLLYDDDRIPETGAATLQHMIDENHGADRERELYAAKYWCVVHLLRYRAVIQPSFLSDEKFVELLRRALHS